MKLLWFFIRTVKCPYNSYSDYILTCMQCNIIQSLLNSSYKRYTYYYNQSNHYKKCNQNIDKINCNLCIYFKCHDSCTKYYKRRSEKQSQDHIYSSLHLIYITCHSCNKSRSPLIIYITIRQALYMLKQFTSDCFTKIHSHSCRKILGCYRRHHAN